LWHLVLRAEIASAAIHGIGLWLVTHPQQEADSCVVTFCYAFDLFLDFAKVEGFRFGD
jgi:hypothetical protein